MFRVWGVGCRIRGYEFGVWSSGFRVERLGLRVEGLVMGFGLPVLDAGCTSRLFGVWGLEFRVQGLGSRIYGLRIRFTAYGVGCRV